MSLENQLESLVQIAGDIADEMLPSRNYSQEEIDEATAAVKADQKVAERLAFIRMCATQQLCAGPRLGAYGSARDMEDIWSVARAMWDAKPEDC